jgi:hypothetical protein
MLEVHFIKAAKTLGGEFSAQKIREASPSGEAVIVPGDGILSTQECQEIDRFFSQPIQWPEKPILKVCDVLEDRVSHLPSIPAVLRNKIDGHVRKICDVTGSDYSGRVINFNTVATIDIDWHVDPIPHFWIYHQFPGRRRLRYFSPQSERAAYAAGFDYPRIPNKIVKGIAESDPGSINTLSSFSTVYMTKTFAHASGIERDGLAYTIA